MKKIILLIWSLLLISWVSFAKSVSITSINEGDTVMLDEGVNTISKTNNNSLYPFIPSSNYLSKPLYGKNVDIKITCKNWLITQIAWVTNPGYTQEKIITINLGWVSSLVLWQYNNWSYDNNFAVLECKPITNPVKELIKNTVDINYQSISQKENSFEDEFPLSLVNPTATISAWDIHEKLVAWKSIHNQPTFVDVLFLQLWLISNLSDSILISNPNILFTWMFANNSFKDYSNWLNKFSKFSNKKAFQDAFSGAITLKDIWIAQDVILWLYKCLNDNDCSNNIKFKHSITNKYDSYTMEEIEGILYKNSKNIIDYAISYYSKMKSTCSPSHINSISDVFVKTQVKGLCKQLVANNIFTLSDPNLINLWYWLGLRVKNLKSIKSSIWTEWLNLRWIFNVYREMDDLSLGTNWLNIISKVQESNNRSNQVNLLKKIVSKSLDEIQKNKLSNLSNANKLFLISEAQLKLLDMLKSKNNYNNNDTYDTLPVFDVSKYKILDKGRVKIKWLIISVDTSKLNTKSDDISSIELIWDDNKRAFTDLQVSFKNSSKADFKKLDLSKGLLSYWYSPIWIYLKEKDWNTIAEKIKECKKKNNDNYIKCVNKAIRKFNRVHVKCNWWGCYWIYIKSDK